MTDLNQSAYSSVKKAVAIRGCGGAVDAGA